jgi:four helix bundle protein
MKRSKNQDPSSRETPSAKNQVCWPRVGSQVYWDQPSVGEVLALRDGAQKDGQKHPFDLEERTAAFGEEIVKFSKKIPLGPTNNRLIDQLVGAGTSIGANYCEANEGVSKKDFRHPVSRCVKECKETRHFLRMVVASEPQLAAEARILYREATELVLIFASMYRK